MITKNTVETRVVTVVVGGGRVVTHVVTPYITIPVNIEQGSSTTTSSVTSTVSSVSTSVSTSTASKTIRSKQNIISTGGSANQVIPGESSGGGVDTKSTAGYWRTTLQGLLETLSFKLKVLKNKGYTYVDSIWGEIEDLIAETKQFLGELKQYKDSDVLPVDLVDKLKSFYKKANGVAGEVDNLPNLTKPNLQVLIDEKDLSDPDMAVLKAMGKWIAQKPVLEHYKNMAKYLLAVITGYAGHLTEDTYNMLHKTVMDALNDLDKLESLVDSGKLDPHKADVLLLINRVVNDVAALQTLYNKFIPRLVKLQGIENRSVYEALKGNRDAWEKIKSGVEKCVEDKVGSSVSDSDIGSVLGGSSGSEIASALSRCLKKYKVGYDEFLTLLTIYGNLNKKPEEMKPGPVAKIRWGLDKLAKYVYFPLTLGNEAAQYLYSLADKTKDNPALSTAYMLLGLLAQAGGAVGTGVEAGVISALTGGVGLAVFAGVGLADLANQIAYYFTDPNFRDAVDQLIQDVKSGKMSASELGTIAGALITLAAMPLGDKLVKFKWGGKLSIYDKVLDAKKMVYSKIADKLYKVIESIKDKHPKLAASLMKLYLKALEKSSYKVGVVRLMGGEHPEEVQVVAKPSLDEDGNLVITLFVKEKGRIIGKYTVEPLDTRFASASYVEGDNLWDVQLGIMRKIIDKFNGRLGAKQVDEAINTIIKTINELGRDPKLIDDAKAMINNILKGRFKVGVVSHATYKADYLIVPGEKTGRIVIIPKSGGKPLSAMYHIVRGEQSVAHIEFTSSSHEGLVPPEVFQKILFDLTNTDAFKDVHLIDVKSPNQNTVVLVREGDRWSFLSEKGGVVVGRGKEFDVKIGDAVFKGDGVLRSVYAVSKDGKYVSLLVAKIKFGKQASKQLFSELLRLGMDPDTGAGFEKLLTDGFRFAVEELRKGMDPDTVIKQVSSKIWEGLGNMGMDEEAANTLSQALAQKLVQIAKALGDKASRARPVGIITKSGDTVSLQLKMVVPESAMSQAVKAMSQEEKAELIEKAAGENTVLTEKSLVEEISKETGLPVSAAAEIVEDVLSKVIEKPVYVVRTLEGGGVVTATRTEGLVVQAPLEEKVSIPELHEDVYLVHQVEREAPPLRVTRVVERLVELPGSERIDIPVLEKQVYLVTEKQVPGSVETVRSVTNNVLERALEEKATVPVQEQDIYNVVIEKKMPKVLEFTRSITNIIPFSVEESGIVVPVEKTVTITLTIPVLKQVYVPAEKLKTVPRESGGGKPGTAVPAPPWMIPSPPGVRSFAGGGAVGGEGEEQYEVVQI